VEDGKRAYVEALDFVASATAASGYLVGSGFTAADLTAASKQATIARPDHPDARLPAPEPEALAGLIEPLQAHPAVAWTRRMYQRHRPAPVGRDV
jgi:hypothetical protein